MRIRAVERGWRRRFAVVVPIVAVTVLASAGTAGAAGLSRSRPHGARRHASRSGGSLTVLEGATNVSWPNGLNPLTNNNAEADQTLEDAIFGELFQLGPGGKTIDDLASGYHLGHDGRTLTIHVRPGVRFTDGTPLDAAAVAFNFRKDLATNCTCKPSWSVRSITTPNRDTVVVHLKVADGAIINQFQDSIVNWMVSPTALRKTSPAAFAARPVGAGPFEVESSTPSTKLVLRRNPHYWQKGHPFLDHLTFVTTANDESALEDLRSGTGQAYESMSTPSLVKAFRNAHLKVTAEASTSPLAVQLNTLVPPFDNQAARRAVYAATNAAALDRALNANAFPVTESFTAPTGLFYEPKVPGYQTYNLAKAKALVKRLGGLHFTLVTFGGAEQRVAEGLQSMWQAAGMKVSLHVVALAALIQTFQSHKWTAAMATIGSFDPAGSFGLAFRYLSGTPFTGVDDHHLDALLAAGEASVSKVARAHIYAKIARYLAAKDYSPFLYPQASWNVAAPGVKGPGLTTELPVAALSPEILWQDVSVRHG